MYLHNIIEGENINQSISYEIWTIQTHDSKWNCMFLPQIELHSFCHLDFLLSSRVSYVILYCGPQAQARHYINFKGCLALMCRIICAFVHLLITAQTWSSSIQWFLGKTGHKRAHIHALRHLKISSRGSGGVGLFICLSKPLYSSTREFRESILLLKSSTSIPSTDV